MFTVWNDTTMSTEIKNNFESKLSMTIEANSKGYNTTVHLYEGCTEQQISDTVAKTIKAFKDLQTEVNKLPKRG